MVQWRCCNRERDRGAELLLCMFLLRNAMGSATFDVPTEVRHIAGKSFLVENARTSTKNKVSSRQVLHPWFSVVVVTVKDTGVQNCILDIFCCEMRWGQQLLMYPQK